MVPSVDATGHSNTTPRLKKVVILAQVPPPYHGQAVMQSHLVSSSWSWCVKKHIPLDFSDTIDEVGKFKVSKLFRLIRIVAAVLLERFRGPIDVLFYPPCGPHRIPFWRDVFILLIARMTARKTIFQFHAGGFDLLPSILSGFERWLGSSVYGHPDAAIVLLPGLAKETDWVRPKRVVVVPNGIEDHSVESNSRQRNPVTTILFVGSLSEKKGILDILRACSIMMSANVKYRFRIVGGFSSLAFRKQAIALHEKLQLQDVVQFAGEKHGEDKWKEYRSADIFCFPSVYHENLPVVLLEAMQWELSIVASRWRAIPDLVKEGENGLLFIPADPKDMAAQLCRLVADEQVRLGFGKRGRAEYEKFYSLDTHLKGLEQAFRETANA